MGDDDSAAAITLSINILFMCVDIALSAVIVYYYHAFIEEQKKMETEDPKYENKYEPFITTMYYLSITSLVFIVLKTLYTAYTAAAVSRKAVKAVDAQCDELKKLIPHYQALLDIYDDGLVTKKKSCYRIKNKTKTKHNI